MKYNYVLGFFFSQDKKEVIMIKKTKPDFQKGKLNGVGGKIEPQDISPHHAMCREFYEETGVTIPGIMWQNFATITDKRNDVKLYCFRYTDEQDNILFNDCKTQTEEEIIRVLSKTVKVGGNYYMHKKDEVGEKRDMYITIKNINVLLPLALYEKFQSSEISANLAED